MSYRQQRYLLMTLDPTHIGAGGYRLGRVDNSIVRDPGTNLPKIPGTSLSGAVRSYAAYRYNKIRCAGQGQGSKDGNGVTKPNTSHCGRDQCPICYTFGFTVKEQSYAGTVNFYDAHIVLFPVHSMIGPVWVSTKRRLTDFGFDVTGAEANATQGAESFVMTQAEAEVINLGWLMLPVTGQVSVTPSSFSDWGTQATWESIRNRIILVPETIFSQVINANLEVRTSVSIDPERGAAQSGALFTYEAIPRATFLVFDLVQDDYRTGNKPWSDDARVVRTYENGEENTGRPLYADPADANNPASENGQLRGWQEPWQVVQSGLERASALGVGGMGTRGFGRFTIIGSRWEVTNG
jgi:CRISPR-associated protein Cmr4